MMFSRKYPARMADRLREMMWPRGGLSRGLLYIWHRLKRLKNDPHAVALGFAIGVFVSFTPFLGLHITLCVALSLLTRGSVLASLIGQVVGNPVTLPFIYLASWQVGGKLTGADVSGFSFMHLDLDMLMGSWRTLFLPLTVGGFALGIPAAALSYFLIRVLMPRLKARLARPAA